jgi:pimeloyl-ACP methyl ester carboxylesterase
MIEAQDRTGRIRSGDVSLFYRVFEPAGGTTKTPLLILHGSNYFDSYDWIDVAIGLAGERPVLCFDHRGFGQSEWSEHKDYSLDAVLGDICNVCAYFGWERPAIMGHSMAGRLGIFFAANFPAHISHLIVADSALGSGNPGKYVVSIGNAQKIFPSVEAAMAELAGRHSPPRFSLDRERAVLALDKVEGGYVLKRDPDHRNTQSQAPGAQKPRLCDLDVWGALGDVACPVTFIRGAKSDRNKPEYYDRIARDYPKYRIETINARHDIAYEAPVELVDTIKRVLA